MAKAVQKRALGRGLSALLKDPDNDIKSIEDKNADQLIGNIVEIEVTSIEENPFQPRTQFNEESLQELSSSIKELGLIQPITVRKLAFDKFQIISGERRWRASKMAGLKTIPAYIRLANDQESLIMALVENIQRSDLDPIEIALSYQRLIDEIQLTQEQMSEKVGKKRPTITNYLRLLKLDPVIQTGIRDGFISMGHGKAILNIDDFEQQTQIYHNIIKDNLSVRDTEKLVKTYQEGLQPKPSRTSKTKTSTVSDGVIGQLNDKFGAKVNVRMSANGKGALTIPFKSQDDLMRILNIIEIGV